MTLDGAAKELTERGYPIGKAAVGAWETGRNIPDAIWIGRLAKLYNSTVDALIWDDALSMAAIKVAVEFDSLTERQKATWSALWLAYITEASKAGDKLPMPPQLAEAPTSSAHLRKKSA